MKPFQKSPSVPLYKRGKSICPVPKRIFEKMLSKRKSILDKSDSHHSSIPLFHYSVCVAQLNYLINSLGVMRVFFHVENTLPTKVTPKAKRKHKRA